MRLFLLLYLLYNFFARGASSLGEKSFDFNYLNFDVKVICKK